MNLVQQAQGIRDALKDWASDYNGGVFIASDTAHMWRIAFAKRDNVRAIICFIEETPRGEFNLSSITRRVDRHFVLLITRGVGFNPNRGDALTETKGNAIPLFQLVDDARNVIRTLLGLSVEAPVDYRGIKSFPMGEIAMDAYQIEFSLAADLPALLDQPEENIAVQQ